MPIEVRMPQLGESIVEGTVTKWLKAEGETIEEFEPLLEVNTDKVDTEIPSPASGSVLRVYVSEGQTVRAGTILAMLGEPGESVPENFEPMAETVPTTVEKSAPERTPSIEVTQQGESRMSRNDLGFISPVVARIAAEHKVDLNMVKGTGSKGRITKKDLLAFVNRTTQAPWEQPASGELFRPTEEVFGPEGVDTDVEGYSRLEPGSVLPIGVVRNTIAEHMVRSRKTSPHVTTVVEADLNRVVAHRRMNKSGFAEDGVNLTFLSYIISATVVGLKTWPIVNSTWQEDGIKLHEPLNIGIAVSMGEDGLIVPVIRSADTLPLIEIAHLVQDLALRAREHNLKPDEVQGVSIRRTDY
jgi:2-oxoglutarate dehydrogenase E2 component (dihydrolipoamide succinyltransferase)